MPVMGPSRHRPNTGRTYFEEKREDLLHKYSQVDTETAGEEVTGTSLCTCQPVSMYSLCVMYCMLSSPSGCRRKVTLLYGDRLEFFFLLVLTR